MLKPEDIFRLQIFNEATLTLHIWLSNTPELANTTINNEEKSFAKQQLGTPKEDASILRLGWSKDKDEIKVIVPKCEGTTIKCGIRSKLAQIFDPLRRLSPRTLQGKLIYRELCHKQLPWGTPLSNEQNNQWLT